MNNTLLTGLALSLCIFQSCHNSQQSGINKYQLRFLKNAEVATHAEIQTANMALTLSRNPRVIGFAKMLIHDYNGDINKLKNLNTAGALSDSSRISAFYNKQLTTISGRSGAGFDKAYLQSEMISTGRLLMYYVDALQGKKDSTNNYTHETALVVQTHLDSVKKILASLK
jgi:predicted outer membrane protein